MAVRVLFDDEALDKSSKSAVLNDAEIKEQQAEILENFRNHEVYIPDEYIQEYLDEFNEVIVNDYGDDYHLSEEEKAKNNMYYQAFKKVRRLRKIYRNPVKYVEAVREVLKCLDIVAEDNGIYSPEKFKQLYYKGKVEVYGLKFPRLKGRWRKDLDEKYLVEFILSDRPAEEVDPSWSNEEDLFEGMSEEEKLHRLFTKEEIHAIDNPKEEKYAKQYFDPNHDNADGTRVVVVMKNKAVKQMMKNLPDVKDIMEIHRKKDKLSSDLDKATQGGMIFDDFERISRYDKKYKFESKTDFPKFRGDLLKGDDYDKYMKKVEEWEEENTKFEYAGKVRSVKEIKKIEIDSMLEEGGWNLRNTIENVIASQKHKKNSKKKEKKIKALKSKIMKEQDKRKRKLGDDYTEEDAKKDRDEIRKAVKKKFGKSGLTKKERKKEKKKRKEKHEAVKKTKKDVFESYDKAILDSVTNGEYEDMDEYKKSLFKGIR